MSPQEQLMMLAKNGDAEGCEKLLALGVYVNSADGNGDLPLHAASRRGNVEVCKVLISHGAQLAAKNLSGWTSLHCSAFVGDVQTLKLLIEHGAQVDVGNVFGQTPLMLALGEEHTQVCLALLNAGADSEAIQQWLAQEGDNSSVQPMCEAAVKAWLATQAARDAVNDAAQSCALKP